jgi:hypothetical protein
MARKSPDSQSKYWYKISVETVRMWTVVGVLVVVGVLGVMGYGSLRRHFVLKQVEAAMTESRDLMERLRSEDDLFNFRTEWANARSSLEQARAAVIDDKPDEALKNAERSRTLLLTIRDGLLKRGPGGEAKSIGVQGQVEYRRGERGEWTSARNLTALYEGDYIKTASNGSAELMTSDGALFTVRPDTVILVSSSKAPNSPRREQTIALESGWVNLSTSQSPGRIRTPTADAQVRRRSNAVVTYDKDKRRSEFAAFSGGMEVTSKDGQTRNIGELEKVVQNDASLSSAKKLLEAPALLGPEDNQELSLDSSEEVTLIWDPVEGASRYALQVSTNKLFVANVIDVDNRRRTRPRVGLRGEGSFVWRVAAFDSSGARGPWSLYNRFRVTSLQAPGTAGAL